MPHQSAQLLANGEALRAQLAESDAAIGDAASNHSVADLASLPDEIEVGIWSLSAKKRTLYVNPALVRLTGRPREAFPTENPSLIPWLHPNDQQAAHKVRDEVFETGRGNFLARLVRPDGEFRWCRFRSHVVRNTEAEAERVDILVLDVHDQVLAEQELQRNKRRLIRILDQNWDVLWTSGPERAFEVLGGSKREIGGWPVEVLFGKSAQEYRHPDDIARLNERWAEIARTPGSTGKAELRIRSRNSEALQAYV